MYVSRIGVCPCRASGHCKNDGFVLKNYSFPWIDVCSSRAHIGSLRFFPFFSDFSSQEHQDISLDLVISRSQLRAEGLSSGDVAYYVDHTASSALTHSLCKATPQRFSS